MNKPFDGAELTMEITPDMEESILNLFDLKIEILKGTRETMEDGKIRIKIFITDEDKAMMVKEFVLKMISKSHIKNMN